MNVFPDTPVLTDGHREALLPYLGNCAAMKRWIKDSEPVTADLKRAVLMEIERGDRLRVDVLNTLIIAIQRHERAELLKQIFKARDARMKRRKR